MLESSFFDGYFGKINGKLNHKPLGDIENELSDWAITPAYFLLSSKNRITKNPYASLVEDDEQGARQVTEAYRKYRDGNPCEPVWISLNYRGSIITGSRANAYVASTKLINSINQLIGNKAQIKKEKLYEFLTYFYYQVNLKIYQLNETLSETTLDLSKEYNPQQLVLDIEYNQDSDQAYIDEIDIDENQQYKRFKIEVSKSLTSELISKDLIKDIYHNVVNAFNVDGELDRNLLEDIRYELNYRISKIIATWIEKKAYKNNEFICQIVKIFSNTSNAFNSIKGFSNAVSHVLIMLQSAQLYSYIIGNRLLTIRVPACSGYPEVTFIYGFNDSIPKSVVQFLCDFSQKLYERIMYVIIERKYGAFTLAEQALSISLGSIGNKYLETLVEPLNKLANCHALAFALASELSTHARHEGDRLRFNLVFGRKYHLQKYFRSLCELTEEEKKDTLIGLIPSPSYIAQPEELGRMVSWLVGHFSLFQNELVSAYFEYGDDGKTIILSAIVHGLHSNKDGVHQTIHDTFAEITSKEDELLCQAVLEDGRISVYRDGDVVLEYSATEKKWHSSQQGYNQYQETLIKQLKKWKRTLTNKDEELEKIFRVLRKISLAPGKGCCLVLGDSKEILNRHCGGPIMVLSYFEGKPLLQMTDEDLFSLMILDGATIVDTKTLQVYGKRPLYPIIRYGKNKYGPLDTSRIFNNEHGSSLEEKWDWTGAYKRLLWGIRHNSALAIASVSDLKPIAITVSSDGPITVFYDSQGQDKWSYPQPQPFDMNDDSE